VIAPPRAEAAGDFERSPLRRALVWLVAIKVAGIVVIFDPFSFSAFDLPKSLFSRGLEWWIGGVLIASALRFGPEILPRTRLHWAVGALVGVNLLSTAFAEDRYTALFGEFGRYLGLTFLLDMVVLYVAIAVAFRRRADWVVLGGAIAAAGLVAVGYAVVQWRGLDPIPWFVDPFPLFGTLGNPDLLSQVAMAIAAAALAAALFVPRWPVRLGLVALAALLLVAVFLVQTRAAALGLGAAILVIGALGVRGGRLSALQAVLGLAVAVVIAVPVLVATPLGARIAATAGGAGVEERSALWEGALRATLARPVLGWGPDGFGIAFPRYRGPASESFDTGRFFYNQAHDLVLQAASTTGVAGLLALIVLGAGGVVALLRRFDRGDAADRVVAAAALTALAAYWTDGLFAVWSVEADWIPWVCLGAAATGTPGSAALVGRPIVRPLLQVAILAVAAVAPMSELGTFRAGRLANDAAHLRATSSLASFEAASGAVDLDGGRAQHWAIRGATLETIGLWKLAGDNYLEAASRYPYRAEYWTSAALARAQQALAGDLSSGGRAAAIAAARRGIEADPNKSVPYEAAAEILVAFGDRPGALREIVRAIQLYPRDSRYDEVAAEIADGDPDRGDAGALIDEALRYKDSVPLRLAAAKAALARGDRATARAHAARAVELDPASDSARLILAEAQRPSVATGALVLDPRQRGGLTPAQFVAANGISEASPNDAFGRTPAGRAALVNQIYQRILGGPASAEERAGYHGMSAPEIEAALRNSQEAANFTRSRVSARASG